MNDKLTTSGIILFAILLWSFGINGSTELKKAINGFLFVLLASIIILHWDGISPLLFKKGDK